MILSSLIMWRVVIRGFYERLYDKVLSSVATLGERFEAAWEASGRDSAKAIWRLMLPNFAMIHLLKAPHLLLGTFLRPVIIAELLRLLQDPGMPIVRQGIKLASLSALAEIMTSTQTAMNWPVLVDGGHYAIKRQYLSKRARKQL